MRMTGPSWTSTKETAPIRAPVSVAHFLKAGVGKGAHQNEVSSTVPHTLSAPPQGRHCLQLCPLGLPQAL